MHSSSFSLQHPNVGNLTDVFSFNAITVQPYGVNNTAVFWGMKQYNTDLHTAGPGGNVQSELLFAKTPDFTWADGWAFPRVSPLLRRAGNSLPSRVLYLLHNHCSLLGLS